MTSSVGVGPTGSGPATDLLAAIVEATRHAVGCRERGQPFADLERQARERAPDGEAFRDALVTSTGARVIAECKRRSPSRGVLRPRYAADEIARSYQAGGAAAISVLTEPAFFDGSMDDLTRVREVVTLPLLRKDFVVTDYQVVEARAIGADAVLLIAAALDRAAIRRLLNLAHALDLAALVEVHAESELVDAIESGADIVGVNNRNLRTLEVDLDASFSLVEQIPDGVVAVAESGLRTSQDLSELSKAGYDAFLIGESLMTQPDPGDALRAMLEETGRQVRPTRAELS